MISSDLTINPSEAWFGVTKAGIIKNISSIFSSGHKKQIRLLGVSKKVNRKCHIFSTAQIQYSPTF